MGGGAVSFAAEFSTGGLLVGFGVALIAVSWAFDGWHNLNYAAGEIKNPRRNIPFALVLGVCIITASACILLNTLVNRPVESLAGIGFKLPGIPAYALWRRKSGSAGIKDL